MTIMLKRSLQLVFLAVIASSSISACSSRPPVKKQKYANLKDTRSFEYELPLVWKGIEAALRENRIVERDPKEVDTLEWNKLKERSLETDWIYSQSRDKYQEYQINGSPRKKYLQLRYKYEIEAKRIMGGTEVKVDMKEEIEQLNLDGTSAGYDSADEPDSSRPAEFLDRVNNSILSAAP